MNLGSQTPKQPKCLQNKVKTNKTTIGLITAFGLKFGKKMILKSGEKNAKRTNSSIFMRPHTPPRPPCTTASPSTIPQALFKVRNFSRTHPSRDVIFFGQNLPPKPPEMITSHDVLGPLKQERVSEMARRQ